jgi:hypothetical protein
LILCFRHSHFTWNADADPIDNRKAITFLNFSEMKMLNKIFILDLRFDNPMKAYIIFILYFSSFENFPFNKMGILGPLTLILKSNDQIKAYSLIVMIFFFFTIAKHWFNIHKFIIMKCGKKSRTYKLIIVLFNEERCYFWHYFT